MTQATTLQTPVRADATAELARFIEQTRFEDIPSEAVDTAKLGILDGLGTAAAGASTPDAKLALQWVASQESAPRGVVIASTLRASPYLAAFANGIQIHALCFDDGNHPAYAHLTAVLFPAVIALGEESGVSGADVLLAYLVGYDVQARIGGALNPTHYRKGWHAQSTLGTLGAAAAAAKILRLDRAQIQIALGIAGSDASGLKRNIGTMTQPFHAGNAAAAGVRAAELARSGWTADPQIFDGAGNYIDMFRGADEPDRSYIFRDLGKEWEINSLPSGWHPKPFPSCGGTHNTIQACLKLRELDGVKHQDVESIEIGINHMTVETCRYHEPRSGREGQFSLEFCAALALVTGRATLPDFTTDEMVNDPRIKGLISRARLSSPAEVAYDPDHATIVTVRLKDGRTFSRREDLGLGKPENPMSRSMLDEKFRGCARGIWDARRQDRIIELMDGLDSLRDVRELTNELTLSTAP